MEQWQRKYLKDNHGKLVEQTTCNEELLHHLSSAGVLADIDLESIRCISGHFERAETLYTILETRKDGYKQVAKALVKCKQTDAYIVLLQGYAHCLSPSSTVIFLGKKKPLSEYLDESEMDEVIEKARIQLSREKYIKHFDYQDVNSAGLTLVTTVEPPLPSLYISRRLFKRIVINQKAFQTDCPDTFVFKSILVLSQLTTLIYPHVASLSSDQLKQDKLTSRFILLENDAHWENILQCTNVPTHLVKFEEETKIYLLEKSSGHSETITKHMERTPSYMETADNVLTEELFVDSVQDGSLSGPGVCICDSPGMGKTLLFANIARKIAERCPDRLVAFISLSRFIQQITKHGVPSTIDELYTRTSILEYLTMSPMSACILDRILSKHKVPMELFLDGFDEINFTHIEFTKQLLKRLSTSLPNSRTYVSSRPNMRRELEATLQTIAFDIMPFTETNQTEFLISFWRSQGTDCIDERLGKFAEYCLETLRGKLTEEEQNITGIPLLCRLLAEVYSRSAKRFARSTANISSSVEDTCQFEASLPKMYSRYVQGGFEKLERQWEVVLQTKQYHISMALKTVFPEFASEYIREVFLSITHQVINSSVVLGILEKRICASGEAIEFVHRTFAEYFVSEFCSEVLKNLHQSGGFSQSFMSKAVRFLLQMVLTTREVGETDDVEGTIFNNSVVVYFLNFFIGDLHFEVLPHFYAHQFSESVPHNHLYGMLYGCLRNNYANLFKFLKSILLSVDDTAKSRFKSEMVPDGGQEHAVRLINIASVYSSVHLVDDLFALFKECFSYDLHHVCEKMPIHLDTPLHFAIERADVEKIQYFSKFISLKNRKLLLSSVLSSNRDRPPVLKRKIDMCKLLLSMDKELLFEASYTIYDSVHVEILKMLIQEGADPHATTDWGETVVHQAAKYMTNGDFHKLCHFLIVEKKVEDIFCSNKPKWKSLLLSILRQKKKLSVNTLEMILNVPGVDVNEEDSRKNTPFLLAVHRGQDKKILVVLAKAGADINALNVYGRNALIKAAQAGNTNIIPFLLSLPIDHCHSDNIGNTFLHALANEGVTAGEYHVVVSLLASAGRTEIFHVKSIKHELPVHTAVKHFEISDETLQLFKIHDVDFSSVNVYGNSLLMSATFGERSVKFLSVLMEFGVGVSTQNSDGNTFAHLIAYYYSAEVYHEILQLLIVKGHATTYLVKNKKEVTPLHVAVRLIELHPDTLNLIRDRVTNHSGFDINCTDANGNSLLMYAAIGKRSFRILRFLIDMGVDLMIQSPNNGNTFAHGIPARYSAEEYHTIIELLVHNGHEKVFQVKNHHGQTPLHSAAMYLEELLEKTLLLLKSKLILTGVVDINSTDNYGNTILTTIAIGKKERHTINPHTPWRLIEWDKPDPNFLIFATHEGNIEQRNTNMFKILIEMGADVMKQDKDGNTFAHIIPKCYSAKEYHNIVQLLIELKYEQIFAVRNYTHGATPFHYAVSHLNLLDSTLELLNMKVFQPKIVDINVTDARGMTALMYAVRSNQPVKFLKSLINLGAGVMTQDNNANTFNHHFVTGNYSAQEIHQTLEVLDSRNDLPVFTFANKKLVDVLHQLLLNIEPVDEPLELFKSEINHLPNIVCVTPALGKISIQVLQILIQMNADTSIQDENGNTFAHIIPVIYSAEQYHNILEILFEKKCEKTFQVVNKCGTPFHYAVYFLELLPKTVSLINSKVIQTGILDINSLDGQGNSLLYCAAEGKRSIAFLKTLLEMGVNVMIENNEGNTFAHVVPRFYSPVEYHRIVELLVERGYEKVFNAVNNNGMTPVHCAIQNLELLEETLKLINSTIFQSNILDVNSTDPNGISFLMYAASRKRSIRVLNALIEMGVSVMKEDINFQTFAHFVPWYYSAEEYHEILEMLLEKGYEESFKILTAKELNPLHMAVQELEILDITLEMINSRIFETNIVNVNSTDKMGNSLLHFAVFGKRSVHFLARLIELGVDVSIANKEGQTFAHVIANYYNNEDYHNLVELLHEKGHGNALHTVDNNKMTPLHCAVYRLELFPKTLDIFATSNPSLETKTDHDFKQEMSAQTRFQPAKAIQEHSPGFQDPFSIFMKTAFTMLLGSDSQNFTPQQKQANYLNAVTEHGFAVLHWALRGKRSLQFVQHLVNLGAEWSVLNNHGSSLAHDSASRGLIDHLEYFVELGCDVNGLDNDGDNVLQCAVLDATENIYEMVIFLIEKGADKFHRNKKGQTAYDYALKKEITDSRILNALMCYSGSAPEMKWNKNGDDVGASGATQNTSGKVLYEGKEYDYVFTLDLDGQRSLKLPYNITEDPWFAAQKFIHKKELSQLFLDQVANIIVNNTRGMQLGVAPPSDYTDPFTGGNRYLPGSTGGTGGFSSGGKTSLLTRGNADTKSSAAQVSKASTASLPGNSGEPLFPVKDFIRFTTAPNYDALKTKLIEFIQTLGPSAGITIEQIDVLLQIGRSQQWRDDTGLLIGTCLQWPVDKVFPMLDLLRLGVLNQEFAKKLNENYPLTSALAPIFLSKEVPTNQMLFLRLLSNVFGSVTTELMKDRNILISQVLNNTPKAKANEVAASTLLLNYSIVVRDPNYSELANVETLTEVLMAAVSMLEVFEDGEAVFRTLVAVGNIISGNPIMSNLFFSLNGDMLVDRFIKSGSSPKIQQCASQIKACIIAERSASTPMAMENLDESTSDYSMLATSASNMPTVGAFSIIILLLPSKQKRTLDSKGTPKLLTNHTAIPILNSNNYNKTLLDLPTGRITMADIKSVQNSLAQTELKLLECIVGIEGNTSHWIVDSVIAGFLFMIADLKCEGCISITPHESAHIFRGETTELIFKADQLQQVDYHNWAEVTSIFVPYNFEEGHWILYVLFPQTREICVLDPVGTFRLPRAHQKLLEDLFNPKFGNEEFQEWSMVYPDAVRSFGRNAMQCGPFVLFYAEAIAKGWSLKEFPDIIMYREHIIASILRHCQPNIKATKKCYICTLTIDAAEECSFCKRKAHFNCLDEFSAHGRTYRCCK